MVCIITIIYFMARNNDSQRGGLFPTSPRMRRRKPFWAALTWKTLIIIEYLLRTEQTINEQCKFPLLLFICYE